MRGSPTFEQSWERIRKLSMIHGHARLCLLGHHHAKMAVEKEKHGLRCCFAPRELSHPFWFPSLLPCTLSHCAFCQFPQTGFMQGPGCLLFTPGHSSYSPGLRASHTPSIAPPEPVSVIYPPGVLLTTYRQLPLREGGTPSLTPELGSS